MKTVSVAIAFLLVVFVAVPLVACGGDEGGVPTTEPSPTATAEGEPTAAPAMGKIAFVSDRDGNIDLDGNLEIYVMNTDGTGLTNLSKNEAWDYEPAWSPDGSKIAFTSTRDGNDEIYVMNADGTEQTNLTNNPAEDDDPAWSPDGSHIAFRSDRDGYPNHEVYVMNADGTGQTNLSKNPAFDYGPAWSPEGSRIAFVSKADGNWEIYVMNADGTGLTNLTKNEAADDGPAWSPDGSKIAFASNRDGNKEIYVMNADGSGLTRLTNDPTSEGSPAWSPDGSRIAFLSTDWWTQIYVMDADGSGQTNLTDNDPCDSFAWSPDGSHIVFVSGYPKDYDEIYVMNADGTGLTNLTNNPASDDDPAWSPGEGIIATPTAEISAPEETAEAGSAEELAYIGEMVSIMGSLESVLDNGAALANEAADDPTVLEGEAWFRDLEREQRQLGELLPKLLALGSPPPSCDESHSLISQALGAAHVSYNLLESGGQNLDVDLLLRVAEGMKEAGRLLGGAEDALPD